MNESGRSPWGAFGKGAIISFHERRFRNSEWIDGAPHHVDFFYIYSWGTATLHIYNVVNPHILRAGAPLPRIDLRDFRVWKRLGVRFSRGQGKIGGDGGLVEMEVQAVDGVWGGVGLYRKDIIRTIMLKII